MELHDAHPTPGPLVISARVERLRAGEDPTLLAKMPSGYAVFNTAQPSAIRGCCMLLPDPVVSSINDLTGSARQQFLADFALLGDAILAVTDAERINYLMLCNQAPELHGHCIPRFASEDPELRLLGPFEAYDFSVDTEDDIADLQAALVAELRPHSVE